MKELRSQFRIPGALAEALKESAESNRRSLNAELVARLELSFADHSSLPERLARIESLLIDLTGDRKGA